MKRSNRSFEKFTQLTLQQLATIKGGNDEGNSTGGNNDGGAVDK